MDDTRRATVLVIDDTETNIDILVEALSDDSRYRILWRDLYIWFLWFSVQKQ